MDALLVDTHQVYLDGLECFFKTQRHSNLRKVLLDDSAADGLPEGRFDATVVGLSDESLHRVLGLVSHLGSRSGCKIAVLSDDCVGRMDAVLASEFDALVHRASAHASLRRALNCAMNGGRFVDERIGAWLLSIRSSAWTPFNFTPREREIADMLVRDCATKEIASSLCVSRHTVKFHVANVYTKAGVHSRSQLKALKGAAHPLQVSES